MDWVTREIITGIQKLSCLGLDREPAAELAEGTVAAWVEALTLNRHWDEAQDAPRFRKAFSILGQSRSTWPAPKDFLEAMPPREQLKELPSRVSDPERAQRYIDEIAGLLRVKR